MLTSAASTRNNRAFALLLLRLFSGLSMAFGHGYGKLMAYSQIADKFPDPLGVGSHTSLMLAIFAEFFCALLLALGLFTRLALVPLIATMTVAAFIVHADDPYQKMELALSYFFMYGVLFLAGPGKFSADVLLRKKVDE